MKKPCREYSSNEDQESLINSITQFHPYTHCIEIITSNPNPPNPLIANINYFHVLFDLKALKNEEILNDIFLPTTRFVSLTPIKNGNGMFIQRSTITFILNEPTYQRFGITGGKLDNNDVHMVVIPENQRKLLQKIRPCEPIEGLLYSENPDIYKKYLKKVEIEEIKIESWKPTPEFGFDVESLNKPDVLTKSWITDFLEAIDKTLLDRNKVSMVSDIQRITIEGIMNLTEFDKWIKSIGENGWVLLFVWDMKDLPGSFVGKKKGLQGCGGGCDCILFGKILSRAHRIQTIEFVDDD